MSTNYEATQAAKFWAINLRLYVKANLPLRDEDIYHFKKIIFALLLENIPTDVAEDLRQALKEFEDHYSSP